MLFRRRDGTVVEILRSGFMNDRAHSQAVADCLGVNLPTPNAQATLTVDALADTIRSQLQRQAQRGPRKERR